MIHKTIKITVSLGMLASIAACSSSSGGGNKTAAEGDWVARCDPDFTDGTSEQRSLSVSGDSYQLIDSLFADTSCETLLAERIQAGAFTEGEAIEVPGRQSAFPVDISWQQALAVVHSEEAAAERNGEAFCDITNWAAGVEFDVTDCAVAVGDEPFPRVTFDLYLVDGDEFFLGTGGAADSEEDRPSSASFVVAFTRQE